MTETLPASGEFAAPSGGRPDLLIIAGEHSGDEHAAKVLADLRAKRPELRVACLGGVQLQAAGAQLLYDLTAVSIVGFVEVVKHYGFFKALFDRTVDWIERYQPRHVCFVDYPGFNLRLAKRLKERGLSRKGGGEIGVSYYIGPQIWAWKAKRRFQMAETLDRLGVIFPFEVDCYADTSLPVEFVGHPFVRNDFNPPFAYDRSSPVLLLPGSRRKAVSRILPVLLESFRVAAESRPELRGTIVYPSESIRQLVEETLNRFGSLAERVELLPNEDGPVSASGVLMSSGTMSLAVSLSAIPGAIVYRLNPLSFWLGRILVKIRMIGISNLLLNRPLHPEYIQHMAKPEALAAELKRALDDPDAANEVAKGAEELRTILTPHERSDAADWLAAGLDA